MDIIYDSLHRSHIVQFLTKHFGFDSAINMMNTRTIPETMIHVITQKVIPRCPKPLPVVNWEDETVQQDFVRYVSRTYPGRATMHVHELSDYDIRMVHTMNRLRTSYQSYNHERKKTILSNLRDIESAREHDYQNTQKTGNGVKKDTSATKKDTSATKSDKSNLKSAKKCEEIVTCRAVKMNGEKCTAKAKNGTQYCCRHSKK